LKGNLSDRIADADRENQEIIFAEGFRGATELRTGPGDGYLYILSHYDGAVFRIVPKTESTANAITESSNATSNAM
jgi:hypothetical protein